MDYYDEEGNMDYDKFQSDWNAWKDSEMAFEFAKAANSEYGITAEEWKNTPKAIKVIMIQMHHELNDHHEQIANLEQWRDEMPI